MSIFVGVIRIIVKIGRLQMGLHFLKKCVMFNLSSCYHLKDTIFSSSIRQKYYKFKTTLVFIENRYGGK